MSLVWRKCYLCKGDGKISLVNTRITILKKLLKTKEPILNDEDENCPICHGKGNIMVKSTSFWNPWRKDYE